MADLFHLDGYRFDGTPMKVSSVTGPVIIKDEKVLLHLSESTGKWQFTGGRLDDGMSPRENADFRTFESLGLHVKLRTDISPLPIVGTIERDGKEEQIFLLHYLADLEEGSELQSSKAKWFSLEEVEEMTQKGETSSPNVLIAAKHFLNNIT